MDVAEKQNKQQSELHSKLWSMANDLRGTMDASKQMAKSENCLFFLLFCKIYLIIAENHDIFPKKPVLRDIKEKIND